MVIEVTRIGGDGSTRRAVAGTAGGHPAQVAEKDLAGPLRELVSAVLSEGDHG